MATNCHPTALWRVRGFPKSCLPRHTGEVVRRTGGGEPQSRCLQDKDHDHGTSGISYGAFPLRPLRGHLPRKTGEATEGGAVTALLAVRDLHTRYAVGKHVL